MTARAILNVFLATVLAALVGYHWLLPHDSEKPNFEFLPQMAHSPRADAYSASDVFADGKTLQAPPAGAIARGMMPMYYGTTPAEAQRAGSELVSPFGPDDRRARVRGEQVFADFCATCHGPAGEGNGAVTQRGVPPPPPLFADRALQMKDGQMFHVITYGQNNMAAYAAQLSRDDRWHVIAYIRQLQQQKTKPAAPAQSAPAAAPAQQRVARQRDAVSGGQQ
jgi:mono/diheme cytochrome c family protein